MSLYEIAIADGNQRKRGKVLLGLLDSPTVARFRDAWVENDADGEPVIVIYTRQGGGNRECCCEDYGRDHGRSAGSCSAASNEALIAHPLYLRDADDTFDATYATFYFRAPPGARDALAAVATDPVDTSEQWRLAIARVESGQLRPS